MACCPHRLDPNTEPSDGLLVRPGSNKLLKKTAASSANSELKVTYDCQGSGVGPLLQKDRLKT